jgi:hypothetical protein
MAEITAIVGIIHVYKNILSHHSTATGIKQDKIARAKSKIKTH